MKRGLLLLLLILATTPIAMAETDTQKFNSANKLYLDSKYEEAIKLYDSIDISNPDLEYNRASAYFKAGQIGKAILHLNRAKKLRPDDEDTLANLRYIKSVKQDREKETNQGYIENVAASIVNTLPIDTMIVSTLLAYLLAALCLLGLILWNKQMRGKLLAALMIFALLTLAFGGASYYRIIQLERTDRAVAINKAIEAYSGPSDITGRLFTFHEGTIVTITREDGGYAFVTLSSGLSGWSKVENLERI